MTAAILVALASAFCFALAATLQQREAGLDATVGTSDPRLLWRLAHRRWWLVGIVADVISAGLHILALSLGAIAIVQPVGVTGLLFAIPMVAVLRRTRVPVRDVAAAVVVLSGLALFLTLVPHHGGSRVGGAGAILWIISGTLLLLLAALGLAHRSPDRVRAVLLAAGAGTAFGVVAVLVRSLLVLLGQYRPAAILAAAIGIALLVGMGYLMLQHAYRSGHFAASLATAVVIDPPAAIIAGVLALHEPLPPSPLRLLLVVVSAAIVTAGIAVLARSSAHVLTPRTPEAGDRPAEQEGTGSTGPTTR
jgi:drug/metabolite transporter (DMT)-like permease